MVRRRIEIELKLSADDWESVEEALRDIVYEVSQGRKRRGSMVSGTHYGYGLNVDEDETRDHETYKAELLAVSQEPTQPPEGE